MLSDKTGTLTQNKMELMRIVINGTLYGRMITEIEMAESRAEGQPLTQPVRETFDNEDPKASFYDERVNGLRWAELDDAQAHFDYWTALCLCNEVSEGCYLICPTTVGGTCR